MENHKLNDPIKFYSKSGTNIALNAVPGHFATSHSHINYYVDVTSLRTRRADAEAVGRAFVQRLPGNTKIDTICCLDGCEVIGAYVADGIEHGNFPNMNHHDTVNIVIPELNMNNQIIFRDNLIPTIEGKNVALLMATTTTGATLRRSIRCIEYYGGHIEIILSIFTAVLAVDGYPIESMFTVNDIPGYQSYEPQNCPMCKAGQKLDAMVNGYGYSIL